MGTMDRLRCPLFQKENVMADLIQIKAGEDPKTVLSDREIGYRKKDRTLFIGIDGKNEKVCSGKDIEDIAAELQNKLTATAIPTMDTLSAESDLSAVIGAVNSLISAMKASGIMK